MNSAYIKLENTKCVKSTLVFTFSYSNNFNHFFKSNLTIKYDIDISEIPQSLLNVIFCCHILPIIWITDSVLILKELDRTFYNQINEIRSGFNSMYDNKFFEGFIKVDKLVDNLIENNKKSIVFYSGGVDARATLFRHQNENPILFTIYGSDVHLKDNKRWNVLWDNINSFSKKHGFKCHYAESNFREFDDEIELNKKFNKIINKEWWYGVKHGMAIISHAVPLAYCYGALKVYIASSNCIEDGKVVCGSDPRIDGNIKFANCDVIHDAYELTRQDKIKLIVDTYKYDKNPDLLDVCWENKGIGNCCSCEKCYRTMVGFWAEGVDPKIFGFNYDKKVFKEMKRFIIFKANNIAAKTWTRSKKRIIENWKLIKINGLARKLRWIKHFDFMNYKNSKRRKIYIFIKKCVKKLKRS